MTVTTASADEDRTNARLMEIGALVDRWTQDLLERRVSASARQFGHILSYHLGWRDEALEPLAEPAPAGKKLRPGVVLLVCESAGGRAEQARGAGTAIELVHNFSLVHDDIQDRSELRRHRRAVWTIWGAEQAINAGDMLFALAQTALLEVPATQLVEMARVLNDGCVRLAEGQFLDIELQRGTVEPTAAAYEAMIAGKTGALIESAAQLGALAAEASPAVVSAYGRFGLELGRAFQEQDDVLGVWGDEELTGKPTALDVATRKRGLPAVLALSDSSAPGWLRSAYEPASEDMPTDLVERVVAQLERMGVRERAEARLYERYQHATAALADSSGRSPAIDHLQTIAALLLRRES